jgi:hypothetical protein
MSMTGGKQGETPADLMGRLAAISDDKARVAALRESYNRIDATAVQLLSAKAAEGDASWVALLRDLQVRPPPPFSFQHVGLARVRFHEPAGRRRLARSG